MDFLDGQRKTCWIEAELACFELGVPLVLEGCHEQGCID